MKILVVLCATIFIASGRNGTDIHLELKKPFSYYTLPQNLFEEIQKLWYRIKWYNVGTKQEQKIMTGNASTMNFQQKFDPSELTVANFYSSSAKRRKVKDVLSYLSDIYHTMY